MKKEKSYMYLVKHENLKSQKVNEEQQNIIRKTKSGFGNVTFPNFDTFHIKNMIYTGLDLLSTNYVFDERLQKKINDNSMLNHLTKFGFEKPETKKVKKLVMIVVDSISYKYFNKLDRDLGFSDNAIKFPISSTFPTITQVCLPTIWSGLTPSEHGIIGRLSYLKEVNRTTGPFVRSPLGIDDEELDEEKVDKSLRFHSIANDILENHINLSVFVSQSFPRFTSLLYPKSVKVKYYNELNSNSFGEAYIKKIKRKDTSVVDKDIKMLEDIYSEIENNRSEEPKFVFGHFLGVSQAIHNFEMDSEDFYEKMIPFWKKLREFQSNLPEDTALVISSDHGAKQLNSSDNVFIKQELSDEIHESSYSLPAGNQRSSYFYIQDGKKEEIKDLLESSYSKDNLILNMDKELYSTLFGPSIKYKCRAGNLFLLNTTKGLVHFDYDLKFKSSKLSDHGGLSDEEVFVPMVIRVQED
jgi:predicted AlkP superfamily pyrophosphatase or phosphodiesterase